jgi:hypothetical protein
MDDTSRKDISTLFEEVRPIEQALRRGVRKALMAHKAAGHPVVVWRDERVVWIPAEEIEIPNEDESDET